MAVLHVNEEQLNTQQRTQMDQAKADHLQLLLQRDSEAVRGRWESGITGCISSGWTGFWRRNQRGDLESACRRK